MGTTLTWRTIISLYGGWSAFVAANPTWKKALGGDMSTGAYRLRVQLRFIAGSGLAQWCFDQNVVRLGMAYHLNEGTPNEERSHHEVDSEVYTCDLIFPELELAQDTWATLTDASVLAWLRPDDSLRQFGRSWADMHQCEHETPGVLCPNPEWVWP